jgi:hypothetical protein
MELITTSISSQFLNRIPKLELGSVGTVCFLPTFLPDSQNDPDHYNPRNSAISIEAFDLLSYKHGRDLPHSDFPGSFLIAPSTERCIENPSLTTTWID